MFDKSFRLDDDNLLFKNTIIFNYKNIYDDNYVVQGFCIAKDYCLVTAYNKFGAKSRVYLYEKTGIFKKYIDLDKGPMEKPDHGFLQIHVFGMKGRQFFKKLKKELK
mgnify:CR=1 FL=1